MLKYVLDLVDLLDDPDADGKRVAAHLDAVAGPEGSGAEVTKIGRAHV